MPDFQQALSACRDLYLSAAQTCVEQHCLPPGKSAADFAQLMDDLHKGLLVKILVTVATADARWSPSEQMLVRALCQHLWQREPSPEEMEDTIGIISDHAAQLSWYSLIRFFDAIAPLRDRIADLGAVVIRLANLLSKADGTVSSAEKARLETIQFELDQIRSLPIDEPGQHETYQSSRIKAVGETESETEELREDVRSQGPTTSPSIQELTPEQMLAKAKEELNQLIGMHGIKDEVRTLSNYIELQQHRTKAGLPAINLSLHMVFSGNPGTGKTTVARIVGQLFAGLGVLKNGHLVETDRSGLVAEYAGQTGTKTNKLIDEALDGVLFIDEAYSLISEEGEDAFGREAVQTLLKRMEDDRTRLVVILAGYPEPIERLLKTNPGLSSRINTRLGFEDYDAAALGQIFEVMCQRHHFEPTPDTRAKLLLGFQWLFDRRDEHFGNGRLVRNTFENALRRLANRIAGVAPVTHELLTVLQPQDIHFSDVPDSVFEGLEEHRFAVTCPGCQCASDIPMRFLGKRVRCNRCQHRFVAGWGNPSGTS